MAQLIKTAECLFVIFLAGTVTGDDRSPALHKKIEIFPKDFQFGVATSAHQVEGAWNEDGKGPSIWDNFTHRVPSPITDGNNADITCDTYHKYKEDVANAHNLGVKMYRFSFSWSRIFPNGYNTTINQQGVQYYKNLLKQILKYDMIPFGTIYHWDLPQKLMDDGIHWTNPAITDVVVEYARFVIKTFPEVGKWVSINEPHMFCRLEYGLGIAAPGISSSAKMAPTIDCAWIEPITHAVVDLAAAERQRQFDCGLLFNPIYIGDWPEVPKARINFRSMQANLTKSRLPSFTPEEIEFINGTADYIGLNHYFTTLASNTFEAPINETSYKNDMGVVNSFRPSWMVENNGVFTIVPYGVRRVLNWIRDLYGNHEVILTETGMTEDGSSLEDDIRIDFYTDYFCNILSAKYEDGVNVTGIIAWSLMDSFEWSSGYKLHFGLYHVDFKDPNRTRVPKKSADFFKKLTKSRKVECKKTKKEMARSSTMGPGRLTFLEKILKEIMRQNSILIK
ncbi:unnamed protein product [Psylliodes chrysocephalus]|uniref:Myrosinase 1-like n=1 Tax=Psylliodes chrysocephalus TaxID=3402493 RepID=A0A9P0CKK1_9CUCU|nr:unnamed protein product [Psylliodes chrysocephala]